MVVVRPFIMRYRVTRGLVVILRIEHGRQQV
jgi:plasmid stabilization system protein ParE